MKPLPRAIPRALIPATVLLSSTAPLVGLIRITLSALPAQILPSGPCVIPRGSVRSGTGNVWSTVGFAVLIRTTCLSSASQIVLFGPAVIPFVDFIGLESNSVTVPFGVILPNSLLAEEPVSVNQMFPSAPLARYLGWPEVGKVPLRAGA